MFIIFSLENSWHDRKTMATGLPCFKVILCGEYGVGKSSMFRRFMDNSFTQNTGPTSCIGLDHFSKVFKVMEKEVKVYMHPFYL